MTLTSSLVVWRQPYLAINDVAGSLQPINQHRLYLILPVRLIRTVLWESKIKQQELIPIPKHADSLSHTCRHANPHFHARRANPHPHSPSTPGGLVKISEPATHDHHASQRCRAAQTAHKPRARPVTAHAWSTTVDHTRRHMPTCVDAGARHPPVSQPHSGAVRVHCGPYI